MTYGASRPLPIVAADRETQTEYMTDTARQQPPPPRDEREPTGPRPTRKTPNLLLRGPLAVFRRPIRRTPARDGRRA
jgi:hypothetical protein